MEWKLVTKNEKHCEWSIGELAVRFDHYSYDNCIYLTSARTINGDTLSFPPATRCSCNETEKSEDAARLARAWKNWNAVSG